MVQGTKALVREDVEDEFLARPMTEAVARLLQGSELLRHSTSEVVDVFLETRSAQLSNAWGSHYGTMARTVTQAAAHKIMQRAIVAG